MLSITNLGKSYGAQTLFREASLTFGRGHCYGVVGANGSGKSSLLRILAGDEEASAGAVSMPRKARVGVLRQDHFRFEDVPILDVVMMGHRPVWEAMQAKDALLERAAEHFDADRYAALEDVIMQHDGYSLEARAAEILDGLAIAVDVHRKPLGTLSGGFKLRVLLAQTLAADPDVLLLDEPTNHLDIISIRWLEKFIESFKGCAIVVSHDHRFLNNVCSRILDVDYERITLYRGNYNDFTDAKRGDRERMETEIGKREKEIADHKAFIERFKAKPTKARQAKSKAKQLERIVIEELPQSSRRYPKFSFKAKRPSGRRVVELAGISKSFDDRSVLRDISLVVQRGDRMAVIGPNGIGKSTLLKIMMGRYDADGGAVEWGYETHPGYFAQDHRELLDGSKDDLQSWLWNHCAGESIGFVRNGLARVLFQKDEVFKKVAHLSGGEAARLIFARLEVTEPNVLVLDEPTNHLDLEGIESLQQGLAAYDGTIIFVSHDRWLVSRLATRIIEITPDGLQDFPGTYDEYLARCGDDHLDVDAVLRKARREKRAARDERKPAS
jgi:ATPase subunit of ABC transporter with duplicated ATPase domains